MAYIKRLRSREKRETNSLRRSTPARGEEIASRGEEEHARRSLPRAGGSEGRATRVRLRARTHRGLTSSPGRRPWRSSSQRVRSNTNTYIFFLHPASWWCRSCWPRRGRRREVTIALFATRRCGGGYLDLGMLAAGGRAFPHRLHWAAGAATHVSLHAAAVAHATMDIVADSMDAGIHGVSRASTGDTRRWVLA